MCIRDRENGDLHRPLDEVVDGGVPGVEQPGDERGQQHEQQQLSLIHIWMYGIDGGEEHDIQ